MDAQIGAVHHAYMARKEKNPNPPKHFLRRWRKGLKLSLEDVAADIGVTHATLSRVERGKLPYTQKLLESLAWRYRCSVADLIGRDPGEAPPPKAA